MPALKRRVDARLRLPGRTGPKLLRAPVLLESVGEPGKSHESLLLLN